MRQDIERELFYKLMEVLPNCSTEEVCNIFNLFLDYSKRREENKT